MWKCNEWWNIQLTLGIWCGPLSQHPLPPARHQPHLMIPSAETINQKEAKNPEMRFHSPQIELYCLGLDSQNLGLREVDLEPSPKRGSDWQDQHAEIRQKNCRRKQVVSYSLDSHMDLALTEVDLDPSAKRGANRTEALVSLYWSSQSFYPKEPPNQISHKSTKVDPIRSSRTWKKSF